MSRVKKSPLQWHPRQTPDLEDPTGLRLVFGEDVFYGETPHPSVEDGWRVIGRVEATPNGLTIREVTIVPTPYVWDEALRQIRVRTVAEYEDLDVNSSVLKLVNPAAIKRAFASLETELSRRAVKPEHKERFRQRAVLAAWAPEKRQERAGWTEDVLEESRKRGWRMRLSELWEVGEEAVKKRLRVLRYEGWLLGDSAAVLPGPTYTEWLKERQERTGAMEAEDGEH